MKKLILIMLLLISINIAFAAETIFIDLNSEPSKTITTNEDDWLDIKVENKSCSVIIKEISQDSQKIRIKLIMSDNILSYNVPLEKTLTIDLDLDKKKDIDITLLSLLENTAKINIKKSGWIDVTGESTTEIKNSTKLDRNKIFLIIGLIFLIIIIITLIPFKTKKPEEKKDS
jgi:hypothetical protein